MCWEQWRKLRVNPTPQLPQLSPKVDVMLVNLITQPICVSEVDDEIVQFLYYPRRCALCATTPLTTVYPVLDHWVDQLLVGLIPLLLIWIRLLLFPQSNVPFLPTKDPLFLASSNTSTKE